MFLSKSVLTREDAQDYDLLMGGWGPDYADPMTLYGSMVYWWRTKPYGAIVIQNMMS